MALALNDRVQQTGTANTTVSFTLSGSVTGYQTFAVVGNTNTTYYGATDGSGNWEVGVGTYSTTGPTLTRTTILASSNAGSAVTFSGTVTIFVTYPSEKSVNLDGSGNVSTLGTIASGTWQASTIATLYGGTGVTTSTGASSNVLRDANANIVGNSFLAGYTAVTAAATTTVLTASSSYYQRLSGSTTQTFQLPVGTTMALGQAFAFDNDSSGLLTIVDNASATVDTVPAGGYTYLFCEDNTTSAGSWGKYALLPATYDFSTTSAAFGNATISSAVWNGTIIGTLYGGTGLSTFTAANNAIYSTSASALAAGTLPIQAGGTAATTFTANGILYGNTTSALGVTAAGTTGQVLIATTGSAPTWGSVPTTGLVTTVSFGSTGLTPATATSGAISVAGTLIGANGGTGQSTYAVGDLLQGAATNTLAKLAAVATGNALISGGVTTASSWGKIGLTTHVSGTLAIGNGGTGITTTPTNGQIPIGNGTNYTAAVLTQGTGITITNASGSVTVTNAGVTTFTSSSGLSTNTSATGAVSVTNTAPMVYPGSGIPNSSGSAWGTSYTTTGSGTVVALATSPTFTTSIDGGATFGAFASSTALTLGSTATGAASTTNIATAALTGVFTKAINIGTGGTTSSTTTINMGSATNGSTIVRGSFSVGSVTASTTDGAIFASNNITAFAASDIKFKTNIQTITNAVEKVQVIGGKTFDWTDEYIAKMGGEDAYFMRKSDAGVIAQDVKKAIPELTREREDGSLAVDYPKLVALAFAAIVELKAEIDALKGK